MNVHIVRALRTVGLLLALTSVEVSPGVASEGAYLEVTQPMLVPGSGDVVLRVVTYSIDSEASGPGAEIALTAAANAIQRQGAFQNTNLARAAGLKVGVDFAKGWALPRKSANGEMFVDSLLVLIDAREFQPLRGIGAGVSLDRILRATRASVIANAERSWPCIRRLGIRTEREGVAGPKIEWIAITPRKVSEIY